MKIVLAERPLTPEALARRAGGSLHVWGTGLPAAVEAVCTDSREADAQTVFCAIRGERVDGHRFLAVAAQAGCRVFLCERLPDGWGEAAPEGEAQDAIGAMAAIETIAAIVVPDTVAAFSRLALARREAELSALRITAVTGSVGKTTTKEMIAAVLATRYSLFKKDGNYNSTIGLPLSFLEIPAGTEAAVLEMGMSARGEIAVMTEAVRPDVAVITNIGSSHLAYLGTRENIARAKLEIAQGLRPGGVLLIPGDEVLLSSAAQAVGEGIRVLRLALGEHADADYAACRITAANGGMRFDLKTPEGVLGGLCVPAMGEHIVWAAAYAAVVGLLYGLDESAIRAGLAAYRTADMRQSIRTVRGVTLIEDCYNAAPESMRAALAVLALTAEGGRGRETDGAPCGRRVAVLGDMRELGADAEALHAAVGTEAVRHGVNCLITVGALGAHIAAGARAAGMAEENIWVTAATDGDLCTEVNTNAAYAAAADALAACLRPGDCVLFKASRAMALERLAAMLCERLERV